MFEFFAKFIPLIRAAYHSDGFLNWAGDFGAQVHCLSPSAASPRTHQSILHNWPAKSLSICQAEG